MENPKILITDDGSHTILLEPSMVTYHSTKGALNESQKVYIDHGLKHLLHLQQISLFEFGFGTGLNAYLSLLQTHLTKQDIKYTSIEPYPLASSILSELNYPKLLKTSTEDFLQMHNADWNQTIEISEHFSLLKHQYKWNNYMPDKNKFDLVYYDAFGPGHDESLWSLASTIKLNSMMSIAGILCTFCAQGQFKRNLKASGFQVESLSGPIGKREVIRATKHSDI